MFGSSKVLLALEQRMKKAGYSDQEILDVFNEGARQALTKPISPETLKVFDLVDSFVSSVAKKVSESQARAFYGEVT